jgi:heme exporter protein B
MSAFRAIVAKDLRTELRTLESIPAMALFAVTTFILFRFGLDRTELEGGLAAGVLLVTILFAAILAINRVFVAEREQGGFDAFRLAPVDPAALYAAKVCVLFVYLAILELIAVALFGLLFGGGDGLLALAPVLVLVDVGLAVVGALVSSIAVNSSARDLIAPLLLLPLLVPLVIAAASVAAQLLAAGGPSYDDFAKWMAILALYDLVFIAVGWAVYDFVLED